MEYISAQQAATKWGISKRRVQVLCMEDRIKDATRIGNMWVIPQNAQKPADARIQEDHAKAQPTAREARLALKKLTAMSYQEINSRLGDPCKSKMVFVSLLATTLFGDIQNRQSKEGTFEDYLLISNEMFENGFNSLDNIKMFQMFCWLIPAFEKYIYRYSEYVDDILSWAYQYVNKLSLDSGLESTQFFTEKYMIEYLTKDISANTLSDSVYLDPACGGGNFLSYIMEILYYLNYKHKDNAIDCISDIFSVLYGYELDPHLAIVASVNLKLKALSLLSNTRTIQITDWNLFCPNIFTSVRPDSFGFLESDFHEHMVRRIIDGKSKTLFELVGQVTAIYTNPPFQTIKGMDDRLKNHLKKFFPDSKCDLCNAFILQCLAKCKLGGTVGLVTQSSWMYLDSFEKLRNGFIHNYTIDSIADLGSGAFYDLSGEKANVVLLKVKITNSQTNCVRVLALRDLPLREKIEYLSKSPDTELLIEQVKLFGGDHTAFSLNHDRSRDMQSISGKYGDYGTPMQGTSTGNAAALIAYYWEHLNDPEWVSVSKGGSYSRWCGLNNYVLKWGHEGEYIRSTPGSALRNTKYFDRTSLVYSDTGTSGFNVRLLEKNQLFVASGPGIRDVAGNPFAHLALLNSRVFSYYLRSLSPKLTIAAGYISRVPVPKELLGLKEIEKLGKECYCRKRKFLGTRPNNIEWNAPIVNVNSVRKYATELFQQEMNDELVKLNCEAKLDSIILSEYSFSKKEIRLLDTTVGIPAADIIGTPDTESIDLNMAQAMDINCQLLRTRVNKHTLGCDGLLEFISHKEGVAPQAVVELVMAYPAMFTQCIDKYVSLCLHSIVLASLGFRQDNNSNLDMGTLYRSFSRLYPSLKYEWPAIKTWIQEQFNAVHIQAFCSRPYYLYEDGKFKILY